jgi:uncharacterized MAPEG superfamily protein
VTDKLLSFASLFDHRILNQLLYSVTMSFANLSVYGIPVYYVLSLLPHSYALGLVRSQGSKWDNANPRSTNLDEAVKKSVTADIYGRFERAESAHKNGMENLPVFMAAVILGNMAKLDSTYLNAFTAAFLSSRVVYTYCYITIADRKRSFFRSVIWAVGMLMCMTTIVKAGNVFASS